MAVAVKRAIYEIKRGANVSQLEDDLEINTRQRIIEEVKVPAIPTIPTDDVFFSKTEEGKPDVEFLKDHFYREGRIKEEHALYIIDKATQLLRAEPNVLTVDGPGPGTVCGNIHGQYYDLMKLFEVGGHPSITRYLFLGDYINRGYFSIECLLYLWTLKIWYPNTFFLLRGHHECRRLTEHFTFEIECKHKYSERVYEACLGSFCALPLVAIVNKRYFCVHGGISPDMHTIDNIRMLNRFREPPTSGLMCDILWSDPIEDFGQEHIMENFVYNHVRGCSYFYTFKAVCDFLERNRLVSIIRAHEVQGDGYRIYRKRHSHPSVIAVFSASNYFAVYENKAGVLKYGPNNFTIRQFYVYGRPHPYRLPKFMDAFSWSLPFICEKIMDMLAAMLYIDFRELNESFENSGLSVVPVGLDKAERLKVLQNKIRAVGRISHMFSVLREQSEHVSELKNSSCSSSLPYGVLSLRDEDIKNAINSFNEARTSDEGNESLPPIKGPGPLTLPNTKGSAGEKAASATATVGAAPMAQFRRTNERGELEAEKPNQHKQSDTSQYQTEPRTNRATAEIQDVEKQLREKERHLQIREAEVQDLEGVLRVKERDLQIREAEVQTMLQAANERREAMDLQADNVRQRLAAMKWEENPRPREVPLTQQMAITRQPNSAARGSDLLSISSISTIRNSPRMRSNVDLSPESSAGLKRESWDHGNELTSLAPTTRGGPSKHTNIGLSSSKSHARLKEDSEYYGNE